MGGLHNRICVIVIRWGYAWGHTDIDGDLHGGHTDIDGDLHGGTLTSMAICMGHTDIDRDLHGAH